MWKTVMYCRKSILNKSHGSVSHESMKSMKYGVDFPFKQMHQKHFYPKTHSSNSALVSAAQWSKVNLKKH